MSFLALDTSYLNKGMFLYFVVISRATTIVTKQYTGEQQGDSCGWLRSIYSVDSSATCRPFCRTWAQAENVNSRYATALYVTALEQSLGVTRVLGIHCYFLAPLLHERRNVRITFLILIVCNSIAITLPHVTGMFLPRNTLPRTYFFKA